MSPRQRRSTVLLVEPPPIPPSPDLAHRRDLERLLASLRPVDEEERADGVETLGWIRRGAPLWRVGHPGDPGAPSPHLVAYTVAVDPDLGAVYLVQHRRARRWVPPGGHVRPGEWPHDTAVRKLGEELGVRLPLAEGLSSNPLFLAISDTTGPARHRDVSLWYVFAASVTATMRWDASRVVRGHWWTYDEIRTAHPAQLHPAVIRFIAKLEAELTADAI